jgi:tetratricopeptide (TPR) repeat protein
LEGAEPQVAALLNRARAAVLSDLKSAKAWGFYGICCDAHELLNEAQICYSEASQLNPWDRRWTYLNAVTMQRTGGESSETLQLLRKAAEIMPEYPAVWCRIGELYMANGDLKMAAQTLRDAIRRFPTLAIAYRDLGQALIQDHEVQDGIEALRQADRLCSCDRSVWVAMAHAFERLGQHDAAQRCEIKARSNGNVIRLPDPMLYQVLSLCVCTQRCSTMADTLLADHEFARAADMLDIVVSGRPFDVNARTRLGHALFGMNDFANARKQFEIALMLDSKCNDAREMLNRIGEVHP